MALSTKIINLIWLYVLDDPNQICAVSQISVVQQEEWVFLLRILVKVINQARV